MNNRLHGAVDLTGLTGGGEFRVMLGVDVENYSGHPTHEQVALVSGLHGLMPEAFRDSGLDWDRCLHLDAGDGFATIFPRDFDRHAAVIDPLLHNLNGKLREYNRQAAPGMHLRLRVAVHMGIVVAADDALVGDDINLLFRLLECGPVKEALRRAADAHIAAVVSQYCHEHLVEPERGNIDRRRYHEVEVELRHVGRRRAWITLPGSPDSARDADFWRAVARAGVPAPEPGPGRSARTATAFAEVASALAGAVRAGARSVAASLSRHWPPRPARWLWISGLAGAAVLLALGGVYVVRPYVGACPAPLELNVLTSPASLQPVGDAAVAYEHRALAHGCARVDLTVYAVPDSEAREALTNGWHGPTELGFGPPPNIWMPDTSGDEAMLAPGRLAASGLRMRAAGATRASPYVVGVPSAAAGRLGGPQVGAAWPDFYRALTSVGLALARPPATSTTALAQTSGIWSDLKPGTPGRPDARGLEHELSNTDLGGGDEDAMLCTLRGRTTMPDTAVLVTERALAEYNAGGPLGDRCGRQAPAARGKKLVPFYPGVTRAADYPMYEVTYGSASPAERTEVDAFHRWLATDAEGVLAADGYRPVSDRAPAQGLLTDPDASADAGSRLDGVGVALAPPRPVPGAALTAFDTELSDLRGNMYVLVAVDTSLTMNLPTTRGTRFDASLDAMNEAGGLLSAGDRIALWRFPARGSASGHGVLVPFASAGYDYAKQASAYSAAVGGLAPDAERTPLYQTVRDGIAELGEHAGPRVHLGLLVISDGRDDVSGSGKVSAEALSKAVRTDGRDVSVLLVNPVRGGCAEPGLKTAGVACAPLDGPGDPVGMFVNRLRGE